MTLRLLKSDLGQQFPVSVKFVAGTRYAEHSQNTLTGTLKEYWVESAKVKRTLIHDSKEANTIKAYLHSIKLYEAWFNDITKAYEGNYARWPIPATPAIIVMYLQSLDCSLSSMQLYVRSLSWAHREFNLNDPTKHPDVIDSLIGLRKRTFKKKGSTKQQAPAFPNHALVQLSRAFCLDTCTMQELRDMMFLN